MPESASRSMPTSCARRDRGAKLRREWRPQVPNQAASRRAVAAKLAFGFRRTSSDAASGERAAVVSLSQPSQ